MNSGDALFRRLNVEEEIVFDNEEPVALGGKELPLGKILDAFGGILDDADQSLEELSSNDLLGKAIVRGCQDLADAVGRIAGEIEEQSDADRQALAEACLQDAQETTRLLEAQQQSANGQQQLQTSPQMEELSLMSPDDIMLALAGVSPLLRDVEVGLRAIEQDEADEIADVALTVARLFVASLQNFYCHMTQQEDERRRLESDRFEILEEDDEKPENTSSQRTSSNLYSKKNKKRIDKLKVLWPPLGPAVASACAWGKDEAIQRPILAVALGMTLWPAAVATAFLGAPLMAADALVQYAYTSFQDGPIVSNVEKGAAQLYQAGKLSLLCGKFATRQSLRVINRQIERQGGIGPVVQNLAGMAVDKALHPIETVGAVWNGLNWAWGMVQDNLRHDSERQDASDAEDGWH